MQGYNIVIGPILILAQFSTDADHALMESEGGTK
jgi:hypothetical protein